MRGQPTDIEWSKYPLRLRSHKRVRYELFCALCNLSIKLGEKYFAGGFRRTAHEGCARLAVKARGEE